MNDNFSEIIIDRFSTNFMRAYKGLSGPGKTKIIKYSPVIFKRWYYSALINETTLSPSFLHEANLGARAGLSAPAVFPDISGTRLKGFSFKESRYSINNHPVVNDFKVLLGFCVPDIELDGDNHIVNDVSSRIVNFLSIGDPYYVEYLTAVAFELKLLRKSDAIYSNKAVVANNYTLFKKLNQEEALKKIVEASVKICSKSINSSLPRPIPFVSEKGIKSLIRKPMPIDDIYKRIFRPFGVDIERIWDEYNQNNQIANPEQDTLLSSTFYLGVILDKWFITPFGEYLKLLEPVYCFSYNFEEELSYLLEVIKNGGNVDTALFSPCAFYSFTSLGRMFFAYEVNGAEKRQSSPIPVANLLGLLDTTTKAPINRAGGKPAVKKEIYSFTVRQTGEKSQWVCIDAAGYNTPHELHIEIALNYGFGFAGYVIFTDESMNRFLMLSDPKKKGKGRKADKVTFDELNLTKGKKMVYISDSGKKLEIELTKKAPSEYDAHFPHTVKRGKAMRQE